MSYISDAAYSVPDAGNSTSSALGPLLEFIGTTIIDNHPGLLIDIRTDVECTVYTEFSVDGVNYHAQPEAGYTLNAANNYSVIAVEVKGARSYRLRITNGAVGQTFLRANSYLGVFADINVNTQSPLSQPYAQSDPSQLTRPSWTWLDVARGLAADIKVVKKFGRNDSVTASFVPVAFGGVYRTPQASGATTLRIAAGGNANDDAAGSGARSIILIGLDENFEEVEETIATAGASASTTTTATFTRLFRVCVGGSGSYATQLAPSHFGGIVVENAAGTEIWATIDSADFPKGQSEIGAYTIPAGYTGFVKVRNVTVDSGRDIDLVMFARENADQTAPPYSSMRVQSVYTGISGGIIEALGDTDVPHGPYVGPTDVGVMAEGTAGGGGGSASVSVEFEVILVAN